MPFIARGDSADRGNSPPFPSPFPRRLRIALTPDSPPAGPSLRFCGSVGGALGRLLLTGISEVMPGVSAPDLLETCVDPIDGDHRHDPAVLIDLSRFDRYRASEQQSPELATGGPAVRLTCLRSIDSFEPDPELSAAVPSDGERITILHGDDPSLERRRKETRIVSPGGPFLATDEEGGYEEEHGRLPAGDRHRMILAHSAAGCLNGQLERPPGGRGRKSFRPPSQQIPKTTPRNARGPSDAPQGHWTLARGERESANPGF
jgi:hypothetical protein